MAVTENANTFNFQIWVVTSHQYGTSVLISQMSFLKGDSCGIVKWQLLSRAIVNMALSISLFLLGRSEIRPLSVWELMDLVPCCA